DDAEYHLEELRQRDHTLARADGKVVDGEFEFFRGRCQEGKGNYRAGKDGPGAAYFYDRAIWARTPPPVECYVRFAEGCRKRLGKPNGADGVIDAVVDDVGTAEAYRARAVYCRERSAEEDFRDDLQRISSEVRHLVCFGGGAQWKVLKTSDSKWLGWAEEDLIEARRLAPEDWAVFLESAELAQAQGRFLAARQRGLRALELNPK